MTRHTQILWGEQLKNTLYSVLPTVTVNPSSRKSDAFEIAKMKRCLGKCKARKDRKQSSEIKGILNFSLTEKVIQLKGINEKDVFIFLRTKLFGHFTGEGSSMFKLSRYQMHLGFQLF